MNNPIFSVPQITVPIVGEQESFPVHRIYCVGRNYADHALEMGADPTREAPFFFTKPYDALITNGNSIPFPSQTNDLQHEVELVVALKNGGTDLTLEDASAAIYGYAIGIDLTRRDLQAEAKSKGRPWCAAKAFDSSAPISALTPADQWLQGDHTISLAVNGQTRQNGKLSQMIWSVEEVIAKLSTLFTLAPGDLIFTGTPAGVAKLSPGDEITATITGLETLETKVV